LGLELYDHASLSDSEVLGNRVFDVVQLIWVIGQRFAGDLLAVDEDVEDAPAAAFAAAVGADQRHRAIGLDGQVVAEPVLSGNSIDVPGRPRPNRPVAPVSAAACRLERPLRHSDTLSSCPRSRIRSSFSLLPSRAGSTNNSST